jgi:hypothetical protein
VHARTPVASTQDLANRRGEIFPMTTKRHEQHLAHGQLDVNNAEYERSVKRGHDDKYRAQIFPFCVRRQLAAVEMLVTTQKCWFTC